MADQPLFANQCPYCSGPLTAIVTAIGASEWACENCQVTYEPCGNYLILRHVSLVDVDDDTTKSDDLVAH